MSGPLPQILITDDDPVVRHILGSLLAQGGYSVHTCESGAQCLQLFEQIESGSAAIAPQILFLDLQLQDMPGTEVLRTLRTRKVGLPIILLSAQTEAEALRDFPGAAAADAFLSKPFTQEAALALVERLLSKKAAP